MQRHLSKFDDIKMHMIVVNKTIDDDDTCACLLQTLQKECDHIYAIGKTYLRQLKPGLSCKLDVLIMRLELRDGKMMPVRIVR